MISWIGGKSKISKFIIPYIPKDIETYCEPFGGAFWVYLKMDISLYEKLNKIVYNDINDYLVNLFMCCKDSENFYNFLKDYESQNKELFYLYQKELNENIPYKIPNFENAMKFAYITTQVWSGISPTTGKFINLKGKYKSKFDTFRDKLINDSYVSNLNKITNFENLDFDSVIKKYDNEGAYFYVDAPYFSTEHYYSKQSFSFSDHERLANTLKNIKGRFSMSYYYFDQLKDWFPKDQYNWVTKDFVKAASAKPGIKQNVGTELLIMNYQ